MRTNVSKAYRVFFCESAMLLDLLVDLIGIEPMTSSMPWKRAPSCATGPLLRWDNSLIFAAAPRFVKRRLPRVTVFRGYIRRRVQNAVIGLGNISATAGVEYI